MGGGEAARSERLSTEIAAGGRNATGRHCGVTESSVERRHSLFRMGEQQARRRRGLAEKLDEQHDGVVEARHRYTYIFVGSGPSSSPLQLGSSIVSDVREKLTLVLRTARIDDRRAFSMEPTVT